MKNWDYLQNRSVNPKISESGNVLILCGYYDRRPHFVMQEIYCHGTICRVLFNVCHYLLTLNHNMIRKVRCHLTTSTGVLALLTTAFATPPVSKRFSFDLPLDPITIRSKSFFSAYSVITPYSEELSSSSRISPRRATP